MQELKERSEIDAKYQWSLEAIFASDDAWDAELDTVRKVIEQDPLEAIRGHLGDGPEVVLHYFEISKEISERLGKLGIYAHTKNDQDTRVPMYQAMMSRMQMVQAAYSEKESFFEPELLSLPHDQLQAYVSDDSLSEYKHILEDISRSKPHVLSPQAESLLASLQEVFGASHRAFSQLTNADFVHGAFTVDDTEYTVTEGRLGLLLRNDNREVRRLAFNHVYDTYLAHKNTISALYATSVTKDISLARARGFETARQAALFANNIPETVYDALIEGVRNNITFVHRYWELRRKRLNLDAIHMYDKYVPLVEAELDDYSFEDAFDLVKKGLSALGQDYGHTLQTALTERWIDVFENPGKRSGAYSTGFYATRPYVLLNFQGDYNSVSTLAHELGHSMHTYLSGENQPPQYSGYSIFLAEIASTVNETLLVNHLLDVTNDPKMRAVLINQQLDSLTGTIYRQTMFAEFELLAHRKVEEGAALTHDSLCDMYSTLNQFYHGSAYREDDRSPAEWSRIPHFYRPFYVFQYATGMSAALVFADRIRKEGANAAQKYFGFLKSGSKDYPLAVLQEAGLNMNDPQVITQALSVYGDLVTELEQLLG